MVLKYNLYLVNNRIHIITKSCLGQKVFCVYWMEDKKDYCSLRGQQQQI